MTPHLVFPSWSTCSGERQFQRLCARGLFDEKIGARQCVSYPRAGNIEVGFHALNSDEFPAKLDGRNAGRAGTVSCPSGAGNGRWGWTCSHPILYYGRPPTNEATPNGFTSFDTAPPNGHPCPKPLRWMKWAVNKASLPGELVLDPFAGSGTTGVAAVQLGRKFIGIERVESYFDIARARIADALARPDLFIEKPARAEPLELPLIATGRP